MQQKPGISKLGILVVLLMVALAGGTAALMTVSIPAPRHAIEKHLDAKDFFGQKP